MSNQRTPGRTAHIQINTCSRHRCGSGPLAAHQVGRPCRLRALVKLRKRPNSRWTDIQGCDFPSQHGRQLGESQRALVAARLARLKDGQRQVGKFADVLTQGEAAEKLNVSPRTVRHAAALIRPDENGKPAAEPELIKAVGIGCGSVYWAIEDISTCIQKEFCRQQYH